ncbi:hypothetical protein F0562_032490 [Nyssa sinensis]|uniref:Ionotropic glutamate receptor C-terminal domain-containing protein n=1 Tax=Nyssa sinensis TaxID=561372 RepID=A0A5J5ASS9_9ASTE|nr:hypothetical protein F0562_032490 [Nyssa sinensis]
MQTWQEAALVADVGNKAQVPILSFAAAAISTPRQWPFLVQMTSNVNEEIRCIAAIVRSFRWRRVIAIYGADAYGGDLGMSALLSEALQNVGSEIDYHLVLPPFSSLSDPDGLVREEVAKLTSKQSRVFIVLQTSLSLATYLFREAKQMRLMGKDTVWVITETLSGLLDSVNSSVIQSMKGAIGMKASYSEESSYFLHFRRQFRQTFHSEYPEEDSLEPGIYALRAYDSITTITKAMKRSGMLLNNILSSNFTGLSGKISFQGVVLSPSVFRIINVIGQSYKELGFLSSEFGFSRSLDFQEKGEKNRNIFNTVEVLGGLVNWPGDLNRIPKGWAMPTDAEPMKIGIPGRTSFEMFVKVEEIENSKGKNYSGFCIDVFLEVLKIMNYSLPYEFVPYNGTYDDLVNHVANGTFDAVVGDVTILANRFEHVEFSQPFAESGLTMIVPVKPQTPKAWMFLKPFTVEMWIATCLILIYTMSVVWLLERQSNPEFEGPWKHQLGTALWFTFSSLFFAHRERVHNNFTRVVVVVWLFVVLALSSSYTASLTSMFTVQKLVPDVTDIDWLKRNNATVGCDGDSFIWKYLNDVLDFKSVFQKGSPLAIDVSKAILVLSEDDTLKRMETKWFTASSSCLTPQTTIETDSVSLHSFWGLYLFSGTISTICFVLFFLHNLYEHRKEASKGLVSPKENNVQHKMVRLAQCFHNGMIKNPWRAQANLHASDVDERNSSMCENESSSKNLEQLPTSPKIGT